MADEGFHEIQLNGKQLIFLFMTAAVVLVVTFLCGVLVGRGVRSQKDGTVTADMVTTAQGGADPTAAVLSAQPGAKPAATPPTSAPPAPPDEDLSYSSRLDSTAPPAEDGKTAGKPADAKSMKDQKASTEAKPKDALGKAPATTAQPLPPKPADPAPKADAAAADASANADVSWQLKVVAYKDRAQADALAAKLSSKGYATFVVQLPSGKNSVYSVRVGKFKTRKEAETAKRRLEKEEQLKPLLTSR